VNIKIVLLVILTLCGLCNCVENAINQNQTSLKIAQLKLLTPEQNPRKALLDLLELCNIKHDGSVKDIIEKTQHAWLCTPGTERWQPDSPEKISLLIVLPSLEKLGMLQEVTPSHKEYDYVLIFGAATGRVRDRLTYLIHLWDQGTRFKKIVLLGSERPLDPTVDSEAMLKNIPQYGLPTRKNWQIPAVLPKTESAMMRMIFDQVEIPDDMKKCPLIVVNSPQVTMPDGKIRRATTADTVIDWLKMNPQPGSCLFISNQPYVGYQHAIVLFLLPQSFTIDTAGSGVRDVSTLAVNVCLDTLARWLYQEYNKTPKCLY